MAYDAAQERGEIKKAGNSSKPEELNEELGLTHKQVHEARQIRDAEKAEPGIDRRTRNEQLEAGAAPDVRV